MFKVDAAPELEAPRTHTGFFVSRHDAGPFTNLCVSGACFLGHWDHLPFF